MIPSVKLRFTLEERPARLRGVFSVGKAAEKTDFIEFC